MPTTEREKQLHCAQCGRFIGSDCLEGFDGEDYTGLYYCDAGNGCNAALNQSGDRE